MEFDSATWTGRRPRLPRLHLDFMTRHFRAFVGLDHYSNAYVARLDWGRRKDCGVGEKYWQHTLVWPIVTRMQIVKGSW